MSTPMLPAARPEDVGLSTGRLGRLSSVLREQVAAGHIPGAVAIVARNDKVAYFESFGVRDPTADAPMQKDAIFRIYSMSKPIVSVAAMMLWEEGRFLLSDPVSKYIPEFAGQTVLVRRNGSIDHVAADRDSTVQDLLRHTSGLTYEFRGDGPVQKAYMDARVYRRSQTNADQAAMLGKLPLAFHPGTRWEYSRSTDVVGRLVEIVSGESLGEFVRTRILEPLGMADSGFYVPEAQHERLAEAFAKDPEGGTEVQLLDVRRKPSFESGGGGMVATALDYARFLQMMLNGGRLEGARLLSRKTVELMTSDHLGSIEGSQDLLVPGYGFGLGFAVRRHPGISAMPGSVGQYYWGGAAGTTFWVDPAERLYATLMIQAPVQREYYRVVFRDMVYSAIAD
ncbi:MAG: beta-lactamase family protein [Acetobacteraceae bacterium]|nr:beta-lactamase family protein [Acetobacteraceae bacterium]